MLEKVEDNRKKRPNMIWIDSVREARVFRLQDLGKVVNNRML